MSLTSPSPELRELAVTVGFVDLLPSLVSRGITTPKALAFLKEKDLDALGVPQCEARRRVMKAALRCASGVLVDQPGRVVAPRSQLPGTQTPPPALKAVVLSPCGGHRRVPSPSAIFDPAVRAVRDACRAVDLCDFESAREGLLAATRPAPEGVFSPALLLLRGLRAACPGVFLAQDPSRSELLDRARNAWDTAAAEGFVASVEREGTSAAEQWVAGNWLEVVRGTKAAGPRIVSLYRRSCDGGCALAMYSLAAIVVLGEGVDKDEAEGERLFREAAAHGHKAAKDYLERKKQLHGPSTSPAPQADPQPQRAASVPTGAADCVSPTLDCVRDAPEQPETKEFHGASCLTVDAAKSVDAQRVPQACEMLARALALEENFSPAILFLHGLCLAYPEAYSASPASTMLGSDPAVLLQGAKDRRSRGGPVSAFLKTLASSGSPTALWLDGYWLDLVTGEPVHAGQLYLLAVQGGCRLPELLRLLAPEVIAIADVLPVVDVQTVQCSAGAVSPEPPRKNEGELCRSSSLTVPLHPRDRASSTADLQSDADDGKKEDRPRRGSFLGGLFWSSQPQDESESKHKRRGSFKRLSVMFKRDKSSHTPHDTANKQPQPHAQ
eukprot:m51a1_g6444 hypothetical protein (611) ;mRNA; f:388445-390382